MPRLNKGHPYMIHMNFEASMHGHTSRKKGVHLVTPEPAWNNGLFLGRFLLDHLARDPSADWEEEERSK